MQAQFVLSAASASDFPRTGLPEIALVGRSNVGKSSLINALTKQKIARTSAAPGKTRLANYYLVESLITNPQSLPSRVRMQTAAARPAGALAKAGLYLVDLPGYGYARGGAESVETFERLTQQYFDEARHNVIAGVLHVIDARHPDLPQDTAAFTWVMQTQLPAAIVASKIDKLSRSDRTKALRTLSDKFGVQVLPISALTGEGFDDLSKLLSRWAANP